LKSSIFLKALIFFVIIRDETVITKMRVLEYYIAFALALLFTCDEHAFAQTDPQGEWFTRKPLPTARQEIPHAVLQYRIFIPGGFTLGGVATNVVEVFDAATNTWSTIPSLPIAMHHLAFAATNDRLYVLGGYAGNSFSPIARVFEFDFTKNTWLEKTSMPGARGAGIAVNHGGKIFVIGGVNSSGVVVGTNQRYDPILNEWKTLAPMPTSREHLAAAAIDSLIYVIGGRNFSSGGNTGALEAYSPLSNKWYILAGMPTPRGGLAAATLHGKLYVFGGEIPGVFNEVEEYDPSTNQWRQMAPMPVPRHGIGAATVADTIFIIGGGPVQGFGVSDENSGFTISAPNTGVEEERKLPRDFVLYQNYPNPFNAGTMIRFYLSKRSEVSLKVHDVLGREMITLVDSTLDPGMQSVHWTAENLPSGEYLCRLQVGREVQIRKFVLIK